MHAKVMTTVYVNNIKFYFQLEGNTTNVTVILRATLIDIGFVSLVHSCHWSQAQLPKERSWVRFQSRIFVKYWVFLSGFFK